MKSEKKNASKEKEKSNIYEKITWLQACFLGDVDVIWCNSLGNSYFETYVMDNVVSVFNFYLHITFDVCHTHTSCTHYMQIFAKFCTYDCVLTNLAIFNCI